MDTKEELLDYINSKEMTGALLLTGQWGCGKSYLVKEIAKELNDSKKAAVARISLFGLDSVAAINKRVKEEYVSFVFGVMGKVSPKTRNLLKASLKNVTKAADKLAKNTPGVSSVAKGISSVLDYDLLSFIDVNNQVGKDDKKRDFVLVFDDLERSNVTHKDLLGAINEYVENRGIKTIIIADEDKIANDDYRDYKEKLIARTIRMSADHETLIEQIIDDYSETKEGYKAFLKNNIDLLKQVFLESKSDNLRTFKAAIADFERVYCVWNETDAPKDNMKWVLYTFASEVFISKAILGKKPTSQEEYSEAYYAKRREQQYAFKGKNESSFYTLLNWINNGIWDEENFIGELQRKYIESAKTPWEHFLLYSIWTLEPNDINEGLPTAVKMACKGELSCGDLLSLLSKIHILHNHSLELPCEIDYQEFEKGLKLRMEGIKQGSIIEPPCHNFLMFDQIDNDAKPLYDMIKRVENLAIAWSNRKLFIDYLHGQCESNDSFRGGLYVDKFDDEMLAEFQKQYLNASNMEKYEFSHALLSLDFSSGSYSSEEDMRHSKENFTKLIEWLNTINGTDCVAVINSKQLMQKIQESDIMRI